MGDIPFPVSWPLVFCLFKALKTGASEKGRDRGLKSSHFLYGKCIILSQVSMVFHQLHL